MKIVAIGGSGLIGTNLANRLRHESHEVIAASPSGGAKTMTDEGLAEALTGVRAAVDVASSPSCEGKAAMRLFQKSAIHLSPALCQCPSRFEDRLSRSVLRRISPVGPWWA